MLERIELLTRQEQRPELRVRSRLGARGIAVDRLVRPAHALGLGGEALRIEAELAELGGGRRVAQLGDLLRLRRERRLTLLDTAKRGAKFGRQHRKIRVVSHSGLELLNRKSTRLKSSQSCATSIPTSARKKK